MTTSGEGGEGRTGEYPLTGVSVAVGEVEVLSRYLRGEGLACALLVTVVLYRLHSNTRSRITLKAKKERAKPGLRLLNLLRRRLLGQR